MSGYVWCCASSTCYPWSALPCPPAATGSSSSSGGKVDAGAARDAGREAGARNGRGG
jgi:hypothetical protein